MVTNDEFHPSGGRVSLAEKGLSEAEIRQEIPVFVNSFNQLFYLRDTIDWFHNHGFRNVTILDNVSTFPALLDYLNGQECLSKARVVHLQENIGPRAALLKAASDPGTDAGFIFTDPDLNLPDPPAENMLKTMFALGRRYRCPKVGLALSLDPHVVDVDRSWFAGKTVKGWEEQFWRHPVEQDVYRAAIDTTFFLYVPQPDHNYRFIDYKFPQPQMPALRCAGEGFVAFHRPWSRAESPPKAEVEFYRDHASGHSTHSKAQIRAAQPVESKPKPEDPEILRPGVARRHIRRDLLARFLDAVCFDLDRPCSLVQVGANDGVMADPVYKHIIRNNWNALLIEPHPVYFDDLRKRHQGRDHVSVVNLGISDRAGELELFHVSEDVRDKYPAGARGCASLNRQRMFDALDRVNAPKGLATPDDHIDTTMVKMRRLDALLTEHQLDRVDILVIDVEGHELEVLDSVKLDRLDLKLAIVECNGPDVSKEAKLVERLNMAGLTVIRLGDDLVGFVRGALRFPVELLLPLAGIPIIKTSDDGT